MVPAKPKRGHLFPRDSNRPIPRHTVHFSLAGLLLSKIDIKEVSLKGQREKIGVFCCD